MIEETSLQQFSFKLFFNSRHEQTTWVVWWRKSISWANKKKVLKTKLVRFTSLMAPFWWCINWRGKNWIIKLSARMKRFFRITLANWLPRKSENWGNIDRGNSRKKISAGIDLKLIDGWFDFDRATRVNNFLEDLF